MYIFTKVYDLGIFSSFCMKMYIFSMFCIILLICTKMDIFGNIYENIQKHTKCTKMYEMFEMNKIVYVYKITRIPIQILCMHTKSMHIQIWIHKFLVGQNCISISLCKRNCTYTYTNCIHACIIHTHTNLYT